MVAHMPYRRANKKKRAVDECQRKEVLFGITSVLTQRTIKKLYVALVVSLSVVEELVLKTLILVTCDTIYSEFISLSLKN